MTSWSQFQTLLEEYQIEKHKTTAINLRCHYNDPAHLAWQEEAQEITQWKWIYITIPEITQSVESAIIFTTRREVSPQSSGQVVYIILDLRQLKTGFIQKSQWFFMDFSRTKFKDHIQFSKTTLPGMWFHRLHKKNIFIVHFNRTLRLELFAPPTSLNFSVHWL